MGMITSKVAYDFCVVDFMQMYNSACNSAHGNPEITKSQLIHLAHMLAPNGIRIVWLPDKSIDDVEYQLQFKNTQLTPPEKLYEKI